MFVKGCLLHGQHIVIHDNVWPCMANQWPLLEAWSCLFVWHLCGVLASLGSLAYLCTYVCWSTVHIYVQLMDTVSITSGALCIVWGDIIIQCKNILLLMASMMSTLICMSHKYSSVPNYTSLFNLPPLALSVSLSPSPLLILESHLDCFSPFVTQPPLCLC